MNCGSASASFSWSAESKALSMSPAKRARSIFTRFALCIIVSTMRSGCLIPLCCSPPHSPTDSFCMSGAVHRCMYVLYALSPLSILLIALRLVRVLGSFPGLGSSVTSLSAHCCGILLW